MLTRIRYSNAIRQYFVRSFSEKHVVFDRNIVVGHRDIVSKRSDIDDYSYLRNDTIENLTDRLLDINRHFPTAIDLGCWDGSFVCNLNNRGGIKTVYECDGSYGMLEKARNRHLKDKTEVKTRYLQISEEFLPFRNISFSYVADIVISPFYLHWTNDILQALREIYRVLVPDGFFTGSLFACNTLKELRKVMEKAEMNTEKILSPHISPLPSPGAIGDMIVNAGFIMSSVQSHEVVVEYRDIFQLMHHLEGMAENNCLTDRRHFIPMKTFTEADRIYKELYPSPNGGINATFEVAYISGWTVCEKTSKVTYPSKPAVSLQEIFDSIPDNP